MVAYAQNEMVGATEFVKGFAGFADKVVSRSVEKLAIVRHNKPEIVLVPIDEYERLKNAYDMIEHMEIEKIMAERVWNKTEPIEMISEDEMNEFLATRGHLV